MAAAIANGQIIHSARLGPNQLALGGFINFWLCLLITSWGYSDEVLDDLVMTVPVAGAGDVHGQLSEILWSLAWVALSNAR